MKKGKIEVEIKDYDAESYLASFEDVRMGINWTGRVPKSSVIDIHEETDWSKVEEKAVVAVWDDGEDCIRDGVLAFFAGFSGGEYRATFFLRGFDDEPVRQWAYEHAMLLEDWLKMQKEATHEEG